LERQLAQARQEIVGGHEVAAFTLNGLHEDRGHAFRRGNGGEELFDALEGVVGGDAAGGGRKGRVKHGREQRSKATTLACFRSGERQRAERAAVKSTDEGDVA